VGASGARLVLTALMELRRRDKHDALVSLCVRRAGRSPLAPAPMKAEIDNANASQESRQPESPGTPGVWLCTERDGIAIVRFDRSGSSVNVLETETLRALAEIVSELHQRSLRGVILTSAKPAVFIAGADLKELVATRDRAALVDLGQQTFERFAALRCVTVSAIHGACAGGGFEMALACDYHRERAQRRGSGFRRSTSVSFPRGEDRRVCHVLWTPRPCE
jgi:hypothetical protein